MGEKRRRTVGLKIGRRLAGVRPSKNQSGEPLEGMTRALHVLRVASAWTRATCGAWGRVGLPKIFLKISRRSWRRVGRCGIFIYQNWASYEKLFRIIGDMLKINVFIVVSHIGETYPEDDRIQGRHGGYDPSTYQWVGSFVFVLPIYYCFSQKNAFMRNYVLNMPCLELFENHELVYELYDWYMMHTYCMVLWRQR